MEMEHPASSIASLLHKLCEGLSPDPDGAFELALSYLSTNEKVRSVKDERQLCQKIQARLSNVSARDADKFNESYAKLKNSFVLKQRVAVLSLLLALSETPQSSESTMQLFPMPELANPTIGLSVAPSSSSKSTIGSASWSSHAPKQQGSNQSLPCTNSNMGVALLSNVVCNLCNGKIFARNCKQMQLCSRCVECDNIILDNFNYCECCGLETNRQLRITKARALSNLFPKNQAAPDSSVKSLAASTIQPDRSPDLFDDFQVDNEELTLLEESLVTDDVSSDIENNLTQLQESLLTDVSLEEEKKENILNGWQTTEEA